LPPLPPRRPRRFAGRALQVGIWVAISATQMPHLTYSPPK
jgi:hypothetical protein